MYRPICIYAFIFFTLCISFNYYLTIFIFLFHLFSFLVIHLSVYLFIFYYIYLSNNFIYCNVYFYLHYYLLLKHLCILCILCILCMFMHLSLFTCPLGVIVKDIHMYPSPTRPNLCLLKGMSLSDIQI